MMMSPLAESFLAKQGHNDKRKEDSKDTTNEPITDQQKQPSECTSINNQSKHNTRYTSADHSPFTKAVTTTKIPFPLNSFLRDRTFPFQRPASLRLRGSKLNLFANDTLGGSDSLPIEGVVNEMVQLSGNNVVSTVNVLKSQIEKETETETYATPVTGVATTAIQEPQRFIHELLATGRSSPRRKLVLNSQKNCEGLVRSLSLRKNFKFFDKTATTHEQATDTSTGALKDLKPKDIQSTGEATVPDGAIVNGVKGKRPTDILVAKIEAEIRTVTEGEKMSLNQNNGSNTAATRPATLTTSPATYSATSPKVGGTPKTLTPTTPHSYKIASSQVVVLKQHSPLATVPETKLSPKTPPVTPDSPSTYLDDDLDSMYSFATTTSGRSTMSCEHPYVARNGTTFSGRKMKYVVHCSNYAGQVGPDYLTPTQRAARQIRRLKELLCVARHDLEQKDSEILRLTREVVELRLFKASLSSPEERSASSDAVTVREAEDVLKTSQDVSPIVDMVDDVIKSSPRHTASVGGSHLSNHVHRHSPQSVMQLSSEMQNSFADSGHFEDLTSSSVHSKDSYAAHTHDMASGSDDVPSGGSSGGEASNVENYELQRQELIRIYEQRIEELIRNQDTASSEIKRSHNDKVEALLQKLAECNTRYADIVPDYEHAKERIRELERQLEDLQYKLAEHEDKQNKMYLHMYQKGQEAERIIRADQALELAHRAPNSKVSINELLLQLQSTQDELENIRTIYRRLLEAQKNRTHVDPEVTLQFLKSAVYYFLTDKENSQGHLQAIESILEFTEAEKQNINKARSTK